MCPGYLILVSASHQLLRCGIGYAGAAEQLPRWDKAGGKVLPGLARRREAERVLFLEAA